MPKIEQFRCKGNASVTGEQSAKSWNGNDDDNNAKMSLERPPSQNMSGTSIIETQPPPASQQIASVGTASNNTTAAATSANMVLSTIPIESGGHVVIHHQQSSTVSNGTNGAPTYTQIARNGMPQNLISAAVVSSSATQLTTKAIPAIAATSSPSKYVVIHPNGTGQYRTADGTTAAYLTAQSNGVGNIVLLATEPMDMTGGEQSNIIVNTSGQAGDEELTSLNWLQDKNLLKDLVVRPNGTQKAASTSPSRQTNGNGAGAISPTSDFQEDSSVSEDNVSSVNSSSDQGISISSSEFSPTSSTSSTSSVPSTSSPSAATFTTYHPQQQPNIQYHQVTVATTTNQSQQGQQLHQIAAPHFINNNSLTKNRNHLLSPNKGVTTFSQSLPATAYTLATDINAPRTVTYNGKSGTTTVVEYKAGSNFSPSAARQLISSHTLLSPQRSPPISEKTTVTITSASASTTNGSAPTSPVSSTIGGGGGGGGGALTIVTSTPAGTPHQHFHKRYIREQMNGGEPTLHQHQLSQRKGHEVAVEYVTNGMVNSSQSQHYHCGNGSESEDYLRTPIKRESMSYSSGNHSPDDRLMTRESLNFESPTTIPNGRPVSLQKASSSSSSSTSAQQSAAASPKQKHPTSVPYDPLVHTTNKPPYSFSSLIFMAIEDSPEKALPVKEIYAWIVQHFPYFKTAPTGWKNSVRHNLSLNKSFLKVEKAPNMGKGSLWRVEEHQRPNLIQALARSPFHQSSAVDKFSPYKNGGAGAPVSSSRSLPPGSPPPPVKSNLDPELFPKLYKTINDMANKGVNGAAADSNRDDSYAYSNGTNGCYNGTTRDYYVSNGGENGTGNNSLMDYSIERLARDCGADSIDDVNAATAMLALKHGPNIFNEHFQNGSPVITSSPSEDHTYSAGGGGNGAATNGVSSAPNGCDNNSSGVCSDAAYESGDERHHRTMSAEELEEQRRHAEGVDALLSFASSAASSPAKRPSSASIEEEHISSCLETMPHYISSSENGAIATTRYITNDDGTEAVIYHHNPQRLSSSSSSSTAYETPSFYLSALPASAKKMKLASSSSSSSASRGIRQKIKRKTASSR